MEYIQDMYSKEIMGIFDGMKSMRVAVIGGGGGTLV